jgi:hypothetical protein
MKGWLSHGFLDIKRTNHKAGAFNPDPVRQDTVPGKSTTPKNK